MTKFILEKIARITKNRKKLEEALNIKITNRGKEVFIEGPPEDKFIAEQVIQALEFGFPFATAMLIKKEDLTFHILHIKDYAKQKNLERIRGRIIGTQGKTLQTISELSNCHLEIKENQVGVIGYPEEIRNAEEAVISIIQGAKHSNVYTGLNKMKTKSKVTELDLGLKK